MDGTYSCPRCGSLEFAIDTIDYKNKISLDVLCRNCGGYQGDLDVNVKIQGIPT